MCVYLSTILEGGTPNDVILDDGAANAQLPNTGRPEKPGLPDESPPVYYGTALTRFLIWIYNLRIENPVDEICSLADDITAAFCCLLYHPDMAVLWATVFQEFLVVPCGMIFGGKTSPSFYMIPGELQAHLASAGDFGNASTALLETFILSTPPTPRKAGQMTRATTDPVNPGAALLLRDPTRRYAHCSFVNDTGIAQTRNCMVGAITNSILSAYVVFGFPSEDRRTPCLNPFKWSPHVSHHLQQ
jgi:hypothetical protein